MLLNRSVVSVSLQPHGLKHTSLPCPSLSPRVCSNSWLLSWWCHPSCPLPLSLLSPSSAFNLSQHKGLFKRVSSMQQVAKVLKLQLQSFQWIFRVEFLQDWLVESPCCLRDSQESSLAPQFESIISSMLSLLYGLILTSLLEKKTVYWKMSTGHMSTIWLLEKP